MIQAEIETLLKEASGLEATSIGSFSIERAIRERMTACKLKDAETYRKLLLTSDIELKELIEAVVVPETWFFRDREVFAALRRYVMEEWLPAHSQGFLRLLSLPCSTGEEAYSMAITLLDAGFPANRFSIDAIDISSRALEHAQRAIYGKNSFRGQDLDYRDRHFETTPSGHRLVESARQSIYFQRGNVFDNDLLPGQEVYDAILCRNMLIYFDRPTQNKVITTLRRLLKAKGILFVGSAETSLVLNHHFVSMKVPMAFAFRKTATLSRKTRKVSVLPTSHQQRPAKPTAPVPPIATHLPKPKSQPQPEINLHEAMQLADQGKLTEADRYCEEFLRVQGPSAKAYHLLGLLRDSAGQTSEAIGFYRKALYLEPSQHDTLLHLALLLEKQGEKAEAKVLYNRLVRLEQKAGK